VRYEKPEGRPMGVYAIAIVMEILFWRGLREGKKIEMGSAGPSGWLIHRQGIAQII
jgi:hypothetical protein